MIIEIIGFLIGCYLGGFFASFILSVANGQVTKDALLFGLLWPTLPIFIIYEKLHMKG
jgi:hypothetical protein